MMRPNYRLGIVGTVTRLSVTAEGEDGGAVVVAYVEEDRHGHRLPAERVGRAWLRLTPQSVEHLASLYSAHTSPAVLYAAVRNLAAWLDSENGTDGQEIAGRIMKVGEEFGEAAQAWIGATGQNPRKRQAATASDLWDPARRPNTADVAGELADVVIAALVAITSLGYNAEAIVAGRVSRVEKRRTDRQVAR